MIDGPTIIQFFKQNVIPIWITSLTIIVFALIAKVDFSRKDKWLILISPLSISFNRLIPPSSEAKMEIESDPPKYSEVGIKIFDRLMEKFKQAFQDNFFCSKTLIASENKDEA